MVLRALVVPFFVSVLAAGGAAGAEPVLVSAALSLTEALSECAAAFHARTGRQVTLNFGPSNVLVRQILHGAPVDLFVSADLAQMGLAEQAGAVLPGSRVLIASNTLVVVVPAPNGSTAPWAEPSPLASTHVRRIAIGDPRAVPVGIYGKQWLGRIGLWHAVRDRLVPLASARAVLTAVATAAVDAGIVYRTDAMTSQRVRVVFEVSGPAAPAIAYPGAVTRAARDPRGARLFLEFLRGDEGQQILARRGFLPASR